MSSRSFGDFNVGVQFAVWVLVQDGLRVPPYNAHPEGDGALRALGLTSADWRSWMRGFVETDEHLRGAGMAHVLAGRGHDPVSTWSGPSAVGAALGELWIDYHMSGYVTDVDLLQERRRMIAVSVSELWWRELDDQFPLPDQPTYSETIYSVVYPALVYDLVTPTSIVIGDLGRNLDGASYRSMLQRALALLAGGGVSPE